MTTVYVLEAVQTLDGRLCDRNILHIDLRRVFMAYKFQNSFANLSMLMYRMEGFRSVKVDVTVTGLGTWR